MLQIPLKTTRSYSIPEKYILRYQIKSINNSTRRL